MRFFYLHDMSIEMRSTRFGWLYKKETEIRVVKCNAAGLELVPSADRTWPGGSRSAQITLLAELKYSPQTINDAPVSQ